MFQKLDLKVSVNCCEGCKRKVKKALQSIDGVYKAQIDAYQPKVTIIGNVDAQTLIKRLAKTGKVAEAWPSESQKPVKEAKKVGSSEKEVEKKDAEGGKKSDSKECKCSTSCNDAKSNGNESSKKEEKDAKKAENGTINSGSMSEVTKNVNPVPQPGIVHEAGNIAPYFAPPPYYGRDHYYYELPVPRPPVQSMTPSLTDYFNDDNTIRCSIM